MTVTKMAPKVSVPLDVKAVIHPREWKASMEDIEWDEEDWRLFCHGIGFALYQIARRNRKPVVIDYQI